jgi:hypothetical protein
VRATRVGVALGTNMLVECERGAGVQPMHASLLGPTQAQAGNAQRDFAADV